MADVTGCPPETLRDRIPSGTVFIDTLFPKAAENKAKRGWKRPKGAGEQDIVWFIAPVPRKDSGVMQYIE